MSASHSIIGTNLRCPIGQICDSLTVIAKRPDLFTDIVRKEVGPLQRTDRATVHVAARNGETPVRGTGMVVFMYRRDQ